VTELAHDVVCDALLLEGIDVTPYHMAGTQIPLGWYFQKFNSGIAYRTEGDTVIIIIYEKSQQRRGLANQFAAFVWFIEFLNQKVKKVVRVCGKADALEHQRLSTRQLQRFYSVIMGGEPGARPGWFYFELSQYQTMQQRYRQRVKKAAQN